MSVHDKGLFPIKWKEFSYEFFKILNYILLLFTIKVLFTHIFSRMCELRPNKLLETICLASLDKFHLLDGM